MMGHSLILFLFSVTSSSVWVNLPAAATLIIALRYFSMDFDMRRKAAVYNSKKPASTTASLNNPVQTPKVVTKSNWRRKVDSPVVEDAMDCFTRHLVSEWVTDLWYSRLTPDREGPEELVRIINDVLAEFSDRVRNINLIDLLTRYSHHDILHLFSVSLLFPKIWFSWSLTLLNGAGILSVSSAHIWRSFA